MPEAILQIARQAVDVKANIVPMCKLGCDDLFERGYIAVLNGIVKVVPGHYLTTPVAEYLKIIAGR